MLCYYLSKLNSYLTLHGPVVVLMWWPENMTSALDSMGHVFLEKVFETQVVTNSCYTWNLNIHYSIKMSPPLDVVLSQ